MRRWPTFTTPTLMPPNLRRAHRALDRAVDHLYRRAPFPSERERVEHLFMLYEKIRAPPGSRDEGQTETAADKAVRESFANK